MAHFIAQYRLTAVRLSQNGTSAPSPLVRIVAHASNLKQREIEEHTDVARRPRLGYASPAFGRSAECDLRTAPAERPFSERFPAMPKPFKPSRPFPLPPGADILEHEGKPHVRMKERGKSVLYPLTRDGRKYLRPAKRWYFDLRDATGTVRRVKGFADLKATEQLASELARKAERQAAGFTDATDDHARRTLAEHLADYAAALHGKGDTAEHIRKTVALVSAICSGAGFIFPPDIDAAKAAEWLNTLRRDGRLADLPAGVDSFAPRDVAALLGVTRSAVQKNLKRHGLAGTGAGKARLIPRAAVEALALAAARGMGPQQANHYTRAAKGFTGWMTRTRRLRANPLETLTLLNTAADVRHARRELTADDLRTLFAETRATGRTFRGLTGADRFMLYLVAAGTGFRANALANLTPADFDLDAPTVTLAAKFNKSRKLKVQPLPAGVAAELRDYLDGKPANALIWGGTWRTKAAEMLRADLEAAGIAYAIEGPDGPMHADFHALRHSFLTLGGRSGIDLRTLQELAGHSSPTLTARYMHVRLRDTAGAVDKLPNLVPTTRPAELPLRLTGTEGGAGAVPGAVTGGIRGHQSASSGSLRVVGMSQGELPQPLEMTGAGACQHRPASSRIKWAVAGLNRGPSDFQSLASESNHLENKAISHGRAVGCSAGRSDQQGEGGIADAELAALVASWPTLPDHIRAAIRALVGTVAGPS